MYDLALTPGRAAPLPEWIYGPIFLALLVGSCALLVCLVRAVAVSHGWRRGGSLLLAVVLLPVILYAALLLFLWWGTSFLSWEFKP
jgi:hypothetical protein